MDVPFVIWTQTVQRTARISLRSGGGTRHEEADLLYAQTVHLFSSKVLFSGGFSHTLHPEMTSPPAHIMVLFTTEPHQSLRVHTLCSTTGSKACCSLSGIGPWAARCDRASSHQYIKAESSTGRHKRTDTASYMLVIKAATLLNTSHTGICICLHLITNLFCAQTEPLL